MTLDIIFIAFLVLIAVFGYIRGFITRLYDFLSLIFVVYVSITFSKPISTMVNIYPEASNDIVGNMITQVLNHIIVFAVMFIGLLIMTKIIGFVIKPLLKGIVHKFSLTKFADQTLGLGLGLVEGLIISYIVLLVMLTPVSTVRHMVEESQLASLYIKMVPSITNNVIDLSDGMIELDLNHSSHKSFMKVMLSAYDMQLIDDDQVNSLIQNYLIPELSKKNISLTKEEYHQFKDIMENIDYNDDVIKKILSNINVSDE